MVVYMLKVHTECDMQMRRELTGVVDDVLVGRKRMNREEKIVDDGGGSDLGGSLWWQMGGAHFVRQREK